MAKKNLCSMYKAKKCEVCICWDLVYHIQLGNENLKTHIQDKLPEEYQNCMTGMKRLKQTLEIAESTSDPRTKLQARGIANDCYKYIMDLTTNGVVITDAIKFVQTNKEKLTSMFTKENKESKEPDYDEDENELEEKQKKETGKTETTNRVF